MGMKISEIITDKYKLRMPPTVYYELLSDVVEAEEEQEPTTKNDLGVDCISREQALVAIRNLYPGMPRVDFNGSLRKWVDKYKPYIECDDAIKELPSVTSQEPFINKSCVSSGVCEHDKNKVLDKIRAEIEELKPNNPNFKGYFEQNVALNKVLEILDKYKAERSDRE